jgi:hypothetical protein
MSEGPVNYNKSYSMETILTTGNNHSQPLFCDRDHVLKCQKDLSTTTKVIAWKPFWQQVDDNNDDRSITILFNHKILDCIKRGIMVFNATFNNISVKLWQSVFIVGGNLSTWRKPLTRCKSLTNLIT